MSIPPTPAPGGSAPLSPAATLHQLAANVSLDGPETGKAASIRVIGGLVALSVGVVGIVLIALIAIAQNEGGLSGEVVSIATSAFGVIGSVVGAYLGIKIGSDQAKAQAANAAASDARANVFASHVPQTQAPDVAVLAELAAAAASNRARGLVGRVHASTTEQTSPRGASTQPPDSV